MPRPAPKLTKEQKRKLAPLSDRCSELSVLCDIAEDALWIEKDYAVAQKYITKVIKKATALLKELSTTASRP